MGLHKDLMNNLILMVDFGVPVTAEQLAAVEADACAVETQQERRGFLAKMKRLGLFTTALAALAACAPQGSAQEHQAQETVASVEDVDPNQAKIDDEWDLGFGEDLAREKAETAQEKAETRDSEQINVALKKILEKSKD